MKKIIFFLLVVCLVCPVILLEATKGAADDDYGEMFRTQRQQRNYVLRQDNNFLLYLELWYIAFILSISFHEAAHAFAAHRLGDDTAYEGGQVTLNPLAHIQREPVGTILVPLLSYFVGGWMIGWASTPYDPGWAVCHPKRSALMSLAGPLANLCLVAVAMILIRLGIALQVFAIPDMVHFTQITTALGPGIWPKLAAFLSIVFSLNLLLFVFNLIPVPPLDGSGLLTFFMNTQAALRYYNTISRFGFIGIFLAWQLMDVIYHPVSILFINLLYPGRSYG